MKIMNLGFYSLCFVCIIILNLNHINCQTQKPKPKFTISTQRVTVIEKIKQTTPRPSSELDLIDETKRFLTDNGYDLFSNETENSVKLQKFQTFKAFSEDKGIRDAVKLIQIFNELNTSGTLDKDTVNVFREKRCGIPDLRIGKFQAASGSSKGFSRFSAYRAVSKWGKTDLKWKLLRSTNDMNEPRVKQAIRDAFQYWANVSPLTFTEVDPKCRDCAVDFVLDFNVGNHWDNYPFDGTGRVLAHAFFPQDGRIHFDDDEYFTEGTREGINLRIVAAHEIGHAIGLDHSEIKGSLMFPTYRYIEDKNNVLQEDDILGVQAIYGRPSKVPVTTTTTKTPTTTTRGKNPTVPTKPTTTTRGRITTPDKTPSIYVPPCDELNEAVFYGPENQLTVLLDGKTLWQYNEVKKGWKEYGLITKAYPKIEVDVRGGVRCKKGYTWFFKSLYVWSYEGTKLRLGFPRLISDIFYPFNPYTAVNKDNVIYLLKGSFAWKFDTEKLRVDGYPFKVTDIYKGLINWIEATININSETYFFKANSIFKYDKKSKTYIEKQKKTDWVPCISPKLL